MKVFFLSRLPLKRQFISKRTLTQVDEPFLSNAVSSWEKKLATCRCFSWRLIKFKMASK